MAHPHSPQKIRMTVTIPGDWQLTTCADNSPTFPLSEMLPLNSLVGPVIVTPLDGATAMVEKALPLVRLQSLQWQTT